MFTRPPDILFPVVGPCSRDTDDDDDDHDVHETHDNVHEKCLPNYIIISLLSSAFFRPLDNATLGTIDPPKGHSTIGGG